MFGNYLHVSHSMWIFITTKLWYKLWYATFRGTHLGLSNAQSFLINWVVLEQWHFILLQQKCHFVFYIFVKLTKMLLCYENALCYFLKHKIMFSLQGYKIDFSKTVQPIFTSNDAFESPIWGALKKYNISIYMVF